MSSSDPDTDITACLVNLSDLLEDELTLREIIVANADSNPRFMLADVSEEVILARLATKYEVDFPSDFDEVSQTILAKMTKRFEVLAVELKSLHDAEVPTSPAVQAFIEALGGEELTDEEFARRHPSWFALSRVTGG